MNVEVYFEEGKKVNAKVNDQIIRTDQSTMAGGDGSAPERFSLFVAYIGTCAGIYVKSFCDQRGIDASKIRITQSHHFDSSKRLIDKIDLNVELPEDFPMKYKDALIKTANLCTVKKHLADPPEIAVHADKTVDSQV